MQMYTNVYKIMCKNVWKCVKMCENVWHCDLNIDMADNFPLADLLRSAVSWLINDIMWFRNHCEIRKEAVDNISTKLN